jgi:RNA-directed DNA polymerase
MLRSRSNSLMAVRRVTQVNAGKYTPGVDKLLVKTPAARGRLVDHLTTVQPWRASPARRVCIPKSDGKQRPLGIPTILDRCLQARVKNALEPEWEAKFEGSSYGFRPGRGCHDALQKIYGLACPNRRKKWILDADIKGAFDNIDHNFLMATIGEVPGRELIHQWLKAGVMEDGSYSATELGTPQGGVISPLLLNIALHGMEETLGIRHNTRGEITGNRAVVRYADDFVVFCESEEDAIRVRDKILPQWLAIRGLSLSPEKTRIVHLTEGFDFLSFNVRHYPCPQTTRTGFKLLTKPSKKAVLRRRGQLRDVWNNLASCPIDQVLSRLNPIIRGWANYHRIGVASETFKKMDNWMFYRAVKYVRDMHPTRRVSWCTRKYWGKLNPKMEDNWVFGNKLTGRFLLKFSWFKIVRHVMVKGTASPDDPSLREYWWEKRKVNIRNISDSDIRLAESQDWLCPVCGENLINGEELHRHHKEPTCDGGSDRPENRELVHLYCHQQRHAKRRRAPDG